MFGRLDATLVSVFLAVMAVLLFWSPLLVFICSLVFTVFLFLKFQYFKRNSNADHVLRHKTKPKSSQLMTIDNRFGPNPSVRHIKTARRHLPMSYTRTVDNYVSDYLTNPLNANYFTQSDLLMSAAASGQPSTSWRPLSHNDMYSAATYRPTRESPISQLGNIPYVRLTSGASEPSTHELKLKAPSEKPVTVRIAPMPQNMAKHTLTRISSMNSSLDSTLGFNANTHLMSNTKSIAEALKRKRGQKPESETEDSIRVSTNKKAKRDSLNVPKVPNGLIPQPNKKPIKRQTVDGTALMHKRFKNNEIFSSYSSAKTPQNMSQNLSKTKRKLSPDLVESTEVKTKRGLLEDSSALDLEPKTAITATEKSNSMTNTLSEITVEVDESVAKKSFGVPVNLHSMADHERDRHKARNRLNRYLNAVKEVTSPKSDTISVQTTKEEPLSSSEIGLPSVPAAAIFTNTRIETNVTTTLLNTPISSVLTTSPNIESLSPQKITADNVANCSMTSAPNSPEVSVAIPTFSTPTPILTSAPKTSANDFQFKFDAKPIESNTSLTSNSTTGALTFNLSNNLFNGLSTTSTPTAPPSLSSSNTSSSLTVPQHSSSTPFSIPNFSQIGANSAMPFGAGAVPTFGAPAQNPPMFSSDTSTQSLFSMGSGAVATRRTAQSSRLRSRKR